MSSTEVISLRVVLSYVVEQKCIACCMMDKNVSKTEPIDQFQDQNWAWLLAYTLYIMFQFNVWSLFLLMLHIISLYYYLLIVLL